MSYSPTLFVHICAGSLGLLSGTAAMSYNGKSMPRGGEDQSLVT